MGYTYMTPEILNEMILNYQSVPLLTLKELAEAHKMSETTVAKHFKKRGITIRRTGARLGHVVTKETRDKLALIKKAQPTSNCYYERTDKMRLTLSAKQLGIAPELVIAKYNNVEKLQIITTWINGPRNLLHKTPEYKLKFIDHFYNDVTFNKVYDTWIKFGRNKALKPSLDHKIPWCKSEDSKLDNLIVMTWIENRAKGPMTMEEWNQFKIDTNTKSDIFIDG